MTSHELAKKLLELPDAEAVQVDVGITLMNVSDAKYYDAPRDEDEGDENGNKPATSVEVVWS